MYKLITVAVSFFTIVMVSLALDQVLTWGRLLDGIADWLDLVLYGAIAVLFLIYVLLPVLKWRAYPTAEILSSHMRGTLKQKRRLLRQIRRQTQDEKDRSEIQRLLKSQDEAEVQAYLTHYYKSRSKIAKEAAASSATQCFAVVAANQNSVLDAFMILIFNISMIHRIYTAFSMRDSYFNIIRYYRSTVLQAAVSGLFESLDDEIAEILSSRTMELTKKIPFADVIMSSILQGFANGFMTYYYGYLSILTFERTLFETGETDVMLRRRARKDTRSFMLTMVSKPIDQLARKFKPTFGFGKKQRDGDVPEF
jgi:uncharacterized membrane protein YcjF (UPF0283 family)